MDEIKVSQYLERKMQIEDNRWFDFLFPQGLTCCKKWDFLGLPNLKNLGDVAFTG
jgi:hypothetical protein